MKKINAAGKTITLKVRYKDFETITRSYSLAQYTNRYQDIMDVVRKLLDETEVGTRPVRLLGITLSNLNLNEKKVWEQLEFSF